MSICINKKENLQKVADIDRTDNIAVSVHILSYNHQESLEGCINSILMQKVDFGVEIFIHDDCSTDESPSICLNYQKKYPNVIHAILEEHNLYSQTNGVLEIEKKLVEQSNGEYIALCEGDDYWISDLKLYSQYHKMKKCPNICFCVHKVLVNDLSKGAVSYYPSKKYITGVIKSKKFIKIVNNTYSFQTSSYFIRTKECQEFYENIPEFAYYMPTNDESWLLYFGSRTNVMYINETMSCYNKFSNNSWTSKSLFDTTAKRTKDRMSIIKAIGCFNAFSNYKYKKSCENRIAYNTVINYINANNFRGIFENKDASKKFWKMDRKAYIKKWIKTYVFKK